MCAGSSCNRRATVRLSICGFVYNRLACTHGAMAASCCRASPKLFCKRKLAHTPTPLLERSWEPPSAAQTWFAGPSAHPLTMYMSFKEKGIDYAKQAVAEDEAGNYEKALQLCECRARSLGSRAVGERLEDEMPSTFIPWQIQASKAPQLLHGSHSNASVQYGACRRGCSVQHHAASCLSAHA